MELNVSHLGLLFKCIFRPRVLFDLQCDASSFQICHPAGCLKPSVLDGTEGSGCFYEGKSHSAAPELLSFPQSRGHFSPNSSFHETEAHQHLHVAAPAVQPSLSGARCPPQEGSGDPCFSHTKHFLEGEHGRGCFPSSPRSLTSPLSSPLLQSSWFNRFEKACSSGRTTPTHPRRISVPVSFGPEPLFGSGGVTDQTWCEGQTTTFSKRVFLFAHLAVKVD